MVAGHVTTQSFSISQPACSLMWSCDYILTNRMWVNTWWAILGCCLRQWVCLLHAAFLDRKNGGRALTCGWGPGPKALNDYMEQSLWQPWGLTSHCSMGQQYTSVLFELLVSCCYPLLPHPSPVLMNIAPFRQTWKSLSSQPHAFHRLLTLLEKHCRFWMFPPTKKMELDFTLLEVPEQLDIFIKYKVRLFNFSHITSPWKKKSATCLKV